MVAREREVTDVQAGEEPAISGPSTVRHAVRRNTLVDVGPATARGMVIEQQAPTQLSRRTVRPGEQ